MRSKSMDKKLRGWLELNVFVRGSAWSAALLAIVLGLSGCKTATEDQQAGFAAAASQALADSKTSADPQTGAEGEPAAKSAESAGKLLLREGDTIRVSFPGAPNLNAVQLIRRDGKITMPLVGEVHAAGVAPSDLEKQLLELYGPQLQTKEISVSLESSAFYVYVVGAILRPGKIVTDKPVSALEAIMEAGGFDQMRANMKKIKVIRYVDGKPHYYKLDMKGILGGEGKDAFILRPSDIVFVPERFTWF